MHPYAVDRMVRERQAELYRISQAEKGVTAARRARGPVAGWRQKAGRALVAIAVALSVPRDRRTTARRCLGTTLGLEELR